MGILLSVTVQDLEANIVRTFETEVNGDPSKQKDRDEALENLVEVGASEQRAAREWTFGLTEIAVEVWWAPAAIVHAYIIDP